MRIRLAVIALALLSDTYMRAEPTGCPCGLCTPQFGTLMILGCFEGIYQISSVKKTMALFF